MDVLQRALARYRRVVYLAQATAAAPAADQLLSSFMGNLETFLKVLNEAVRAHVQEFILFSSGGAVYGEPGKLPVREDDPKHPLSPYGVLKMTMEHLYGISEVPLRLLHGTSQISQVPLRHL